MTALLAQLIIWPSFGIAIFYLINQLLPIIVCQFDSRLAAAMQPSRSEINYEWHKWIPQRILAIIHKNLLQAGYRTTRHLNYYLLALILPLPALLLSSAIFGSSPTQAFLAGILSIVLVNSWLGSKVRKRKRAFQISLYKIYRFLDLQLSAGVKAIDVIKGLSSAIDQPGIKPDFIRFCAQLELTLDLDRALQELENVFAGPDMYLLASQLRNSLQTGIVGNAFLRMENLMFNRHLALIQARSKQFRTWLLLVGLLALVPVEILFAYPLIAQAIQAIGQIYAP